MRDVHAVQACESRIHQGMTMLLRLLTVVAGTVILLGGILLLVQHGHAVTSFHTFTGEPASLRFVSQIASGALHGSAPAVVQLGILLLIATPVLRVVFIGIGYAVERDWLYVSVALIVLAILYSSLVRTGV